MAGALFTEKRISGKTQFSGRVFSVKLDTVELHTGKRVEREVVEHSGGVVILPMTANGKVIMVRQFRYPFSKTLLELPAGKIEPGEHHRAAARRELSEETGYAARRLLYMGEIYPSPGFCNEVLHMYAALGLRRGQARPDEDEYLRVVPVPIGKLTQMVASNVIRDAKTFVGVTKFMILLNRIISAKEGDDA
jgi:ADP-ribose pyrophosphatase